MRNLPPLNAIRSFEAAARHLSFTAAARELNVTPGAVSRAVNHLESRLQIALFQRHKRRLQLTQAGQAYLQQVEDVLNRLSHGTEELLKHRGRGGNLVLGVLPTLASRWLIPQLNTFVQHHPEISLELKTVASDFSLSLADIDFDRLGLDAAIYFGDGGWSGVATHKLWQERLVPIASQSLLTRFPVVTTPADIQTLPLLLHTTRPQVWQQWATACGLQNWQPTWQARFEHYDMIIEACLAGIGVGLVPEQLVCSELVSGQLVTLLNSSLDRPEGYYFLCPPSHTDTPKVRLFLEWLLRETGKIRNNHSQ